MFLKLVTEAKFTENGMKMKRKRKRKKKDGLYYFFLSYSSNRFTIRFSGIIFSLSVIRSFSTKKKSL